MLRDHHVKVLIDHTDALVAAGAAAILQQDETLDIVTQDGSASHQKVIVIADYESGLRYADSDRFGHVLILTHLDTETHIRCALERGIRGYLDVQCSADALRRAVLALCNGTTAFSNCVTSRIAESMTHPDLTERELSVLRVLMKGLSNKAISNRLAISEGTVKSHVKSIFSKLRVSARAEAVVVAHQRGLVADINLTTSARQRGPGPASSRRDRYAFVGRIATSAL